MMGGKDGVDVKRRFRGKEQWTGRTTARKYYTVHEARKKITRPCKKSVVEKQREINVSVNAITHLSTFTISCW